MFLSAVLRSCSVGGSLVIHKGAAGEVETFSLCDGNSSGSNQEGEIEYEERLRQRKQQRDNPSGYMNCDFILGLAAEVERLWSIATNVLTDERKKTSPLMVEAVFFTSEF